MRILHTSDWHLGQNFYGKTRQAEHQAFLDWMINQVSAHRVDAVLVAGDVFDNGAPASYARELYNNFCLAMHQLGCQLVVLGGNHDSVATLKESRSLLAQLGTLVIPSAMAELEQQVLELTDRNGNTGAIICAVPFLRPRDLLSSEAGQSAEQKSRELGQAIADHYNALYRKADEKRDNRNIPVIATGHLTAMGVRTSESVRDIYIGTLEAFPASAFPPADYIALGHIHRPQIVAKSDHIRYCGSPIPLSFDELGTQKQVLIASFEQQQLVSVEPLHVPSFQPIQALRGDLETIRLQLEQIETDDVQPVWLSLDVNEQDHLTDLQQRIQQITSDLNVEVLQLRRARRQQAERQREYQETLAELTPLQVFDRRIELSEHEVDQNQRIRLQFERILAEVESGEEHQ